MAGFLDACRFNPTLGGTTDWTYSTAVTGYQSPALAGVVNGRLYKYRAESADLSQWEIGEGAYNTSTGVLARTTVLFNSSGTGTATGQSGAGTKITFSTVPQVAVIALKEDLLSIEEANAFSTAQKKQAQSNILVPRVVTSYLTGSGTHTITTGCTSIRVTLCGGGGGGQGGGSSTTGGSGGAGGNTTFGTSLLVGNGGLGASSPNTPTAGGTASLGGAAGIAIQGGGGGGGGQSAAGGGYYTGAPGGASIFGAAGAASGAGTAGGAAPANSGGGGGGGNSSVGGASINFGVGGSGGGGVIAYINSPAATYAYAVGAAGTAGTAGTGGTAGAAGGSGAIIVEEFFGS